MQTVTESREERTRVVPIPEKESGLRPRKVNRGKARSALAYSLGLFVLFQVGLTLIIEKWLPELRDPL